MTDFPFLQSYVAPICRFSERGAMNWLERLHGTGFLIGTEGIFLTAHHVLEEALAEVKELGGKLGIFPMQSVAGKSASLTVLIEGYEAAPEPFDIAIFSTAYRSGTPLRLHNHPQVE